MSATDNGLSQGEIETIIENATVGTVASPVISAGALRELTINDAESGEILFNSVKGPTDTEEDLIFRAIEGWQEQVGVPSDQEEQLRENREELEMQLGINLPSVPAPAPGETATAEPPTPTEDLTEEEERFMQQLTRAMDAANFPWTGDGGVEVPATVSKEDGGFVIRPVEGKIEAVSEYLDDAGEVGKLTVRQGPNESPAQTIINYLAQLTFELTREHSGQIDIEAAESALQGTDTPTEIDVEDELGVDVMPPGEAQQLDEEAADEAIEGDETAENIAERIGEVRERGEEAISDVEPEKPSGVEFIQRMRDAGNQVMQNPFGNPVIEIIVPEELQADTWDIIRKWDLNPSGPGVMPQPPSFSDDRPDVSEGLVGFQFFLDESDEIESAGFDIASIVDELEGEPFLITKSPSVNVSIG